MNARTDLALELREDGFVTRLRYGESWQESPVSRPLDALTVSGFGVDFLEGAGDGFRWRTQVTAQAGGFLLETTLHVDAPLEFSPAMILWLGALDNMDDRQAHTWRQTILRAPTTNQNGLGGNDLPACYLYDHASRTETICFFPPDAFAWTPHRFYDFTMREVTVYRPGGKYGVGLLPNSPNVTLALPPGEHRFAWWFTQRHVEQPPTPWDAQRRLIEAVTPLLTPMPTPMENRIGWDQMARRTLRDLESPDCWIEIAGQTGLRAYVRGSSALRRDEARGFELMTQLDVLYPLLVWREVTGSRDADAVIEKLRRTLPLFARPQWDFVANNFPPRPGDSFMDTWYFLENALIKLPWAAYLLDDPALQDLFFSGLRGAQTLAHNTRYLFPLFADASDWQPRGGLLNAGVGGLYAVGCLIAHQLRPQTGDYLTEAANALLTMHALPPGQLYHEPQQLSFAAAAANFLARYDATHDWRGIAQDFVTTVLRMGYWGTDAAVPFYDPRGMFQACASLCYPAYKENVETILPWSELLADGIGPAELLARFANLQRQHNYAFFDPYLPENLRRGTSCAYVPYEDLATAEFSHTAELGKELYGAGEVFWSALLFELLPDPDILCLSLDVPCVELKRAGKASRRLLYNPTEQARTVIVGKQDVLLPPGVTILKGCPMPMPMPMPMPLFTRHPNNPLISPADVKPSRPDFEVIGAFNAGATVCDGEILLLLRVAERPINPAADTILIPYLDESGKVALKTFRRDDPAYDSSDSRLVAEKATGAIWLTSLSHLRLARSKDGVHFSIDERPWLQGEPPYEAFGVEDARITQIRERYYVNFTAVSPVGIATALVSTSDFKQIDRHGVIFPPSNRDVTLFPEQVGGRYLCYHRPMPGMFARLNIWMAASPDLIHWGDHHLVLESSDALGRVGGGAPPIKTDAGWLSIYHAADANNRYVLSAFLTALDAPGRIIAHSPAPILVPEAPYEVTGFFGNVVFTCGTVVQGDRLMVYYGAADERIALAECSLNALVKSLEAV